MATPLRADSTAKKDIQKLQRAIVDGLEDVKAQEIQVFDTEAQSALFERVIVASGTSNRQTKALASSVVDAVRDIGLPKPRVEGQENGEWIIVDCGQAVVHIMQPAIRQYYRLEDLWGDKPVRLKFGATKPAAPTTLSTHIKPISASTTPAKAVGKTPAKKTVSRAPARKTAVSRAPAGTPAASRAPAKKAATSSAKAAAARSTTAAKSSSAKRVVVGAPKVAPKAAPKAARKAAPKK